MPGKPRKRTNFFKLGTRGRRGRVAYDRRWGRLGHRGSEKGPVDTSTGAAVREEHRDGDNCGDEIGITEGRSTEALDIVAVDVGDVSGRAVMDVDEAAPAVIPPIERLDTIQSSVSHVPRSRSTRHEADENEHIIDRAEFRSRGDNEAAILDLLDTACLEMSDADTAANEGNGYEDGESVAECDEEQEVEAGVRQEDVARNNGDENIAAAACQAFRPSQIEKLLAKLTKWQNILSVTVVSGSVLFSVDQFESFRTVINVLLEKGFPGQAKMPAYSTVQRTLLPTLRSWGFLHSEIHTAPFDSSKAGARQRDSEELNVGKFLVINPSTWSVMDVQCPQSWEQLKNASARDHIDGDVLPFKSIGNSPISRERQKVLSVLSLLPGAAPVDGPSRSFQYEYTHHCMYDIAFRCLNQFPPEVLQFLNTSVDDNGQVTSVTAKPMSTFLVRKNMTPLHLPKPSEQDIAKGTFSWLSMMGTGLWSAGDLCTSLETGTNAMYALVLVHHQARPGRFSRRRELMYVPYYLTGSGQNQHCTFRWTESRKATVVDVKAAGSFRLNLVSPRRPLGTRDDEVPVVPSYGQLRNGMRYFIDHILLYSDGFSQYNFKQGSSGGVYCVSLNYPTHLRRTRERVRVLTLTPPGISTTEGLRAIIPDLVRSCTRGVPCRNADGEDMVLFTDVVGYVGDYSEVCTVLDVVGINGVAPCHLCSFLRFKGHASKASRYGYLTTTHSGNSCYARMGGRTEAIRQSHIGDNVLVSMGLNPMAKAKKKNSPLFELYESLMDRLKTVNIPLTDRNVQVVNPLFDPYRSVFVAPDHLLAGVAINELNLMFKSLPNGRRRKQVDYMIRYLLQRNGLLQESRVFDLEKKSLYSTSISGTFCRLLVSVPAFSEIAHNISSPDEMYEGDLMLLREIIGNVRLFQQLVARTYWYPKIDVDSPQSVSEFVRENGQAHIASLQEMCNEYVMKCNDICKRSRIASTELDKPNLHRLIELYIHSVPAAGHVQHFAELIFECAHQPLKRAMAKSNF